MGMYRLLIIDDEATVRNGLKGLIDWKEYEIEICGEAEDGVEGLEKVLQYQPDLVLVDIKMPEMGGIEMIQEARKQGFMGKCIILTGYSEFDFAKQAIKLGVEAYLLKPVDEEELMECVEAILKELKGKEKQEKKEVLRKLLLCMENRESLRNKLEQYDFDRDCHKFCVAIVATGKEQGTIEYSQRLQEKQKAFLFGLDGMEIIPLENKLVLVGRNIGLEEFSKRLQENNIKIKERYEEGFFIAVGLEVVQWEDLHFSYESAKLLLSHQFLFESSEVVTLENCWLPGEVKPKNILDSLIKAIEVGDEEAIKLLFDKHMVYYRSHFKREDDIKLYFLEILLKVHDTIEKEYIDQSKKILTLAEIANEVRNAGSLCELTNILTDICVKISRQVASDSGQVINRMFSYMEKHYAEDLTLKSISEIFNYNSAYLGKLFREMNGEGFVSALDHIRIENAKRLIMEGNLKTYQISEKVGYNNIDYFYTKFKKYVGKNPKEFKAEAQ